ncbi:MAG: helix-turn-helix transcriptional regulator [archaeon]|nr:helix-turn-helix transcriptional regulator [archaeon]
MKTFVRYLRQEKGISQKDFAKQIGVTRQTISALENGRYNPSLLLAYKITKLLGCESIEEVFIFGPEDLE